MYMILYGVLLIPYVLARRKKYADMGWIHIALYLVAGVTSASCVVLDKNLFEKAQDLEISFNALVRLKSRFTRGNKFIITTKELIKSNLNIS